MSNMQCVHHVISGKSRYFINMLLLLLLALPIIQAVNGNDDDP